MGWVRKRVDEDGKARYQANYRDARGRVHSAGTFATKREAERAWLQRELLLSQGRLGAAAPDPQPRPGPELLSSEQVGTYLASARRR
jgi:hypothetical protein